VPLEERRAFRTALDRVTPAHDATVDLTLNGSEAPISVALRVIPRAAPRAIALVLPSAGGRAPATIDKEESGFRPEHFFHRLPQAAIGVGRDHRVAFANVAALRLLGRELRPHEPIENMQLPAELQAFIERLLTAAAALPPQTLELPHGRIVHLVGVPPTRDEAAVLLLEDVTAQQQRDRVMREFVRNAAHQLRTPLTGIATAVEVLQSGAKDDPADRDRFLEHVERHTSRLTRIARALLVLARAQSGELIRLEFVELRPLLEGLASTAQAAPGVTIETACPPTLAALAERDLVHEAVAALVDNAVTHTREGTIRLSASNCDGRVSIRVVDEGPGILPEHRERLFEPFYKTSADGAGFGLGLAIAAQAVAAMGGELQADDDADGGAAFTIVLPSARVVR
jgi:two-component system, OmpR family, phosphate regulon sensor histidine kinase PhoR